MHTSPPLEQLFARAATLHRGGELAAAERAYRRILDVAPDHAGTKFQLGLLHSQRGNHDGAADLMAAALVGLPRLPGPLLATGVELTRAKRLDEALAMFDRAVATWPDLADAHVCRGNVLHQLGRFADAVESYDRVIARGDANADAHYNRGNALAKLDRHGDALESYERALALRPDDVNALINSGNTLSRLGRYEDALSRLAQILARHPNHAEALGNRGNALRKLGRPAQALASYEQVLALRPEDAQSHLNRGMALHELGRLEDALAAFDRALELEPSHAQVLNSRGNVLLDLDRNSDALADFDRALGIEPELAAALNNRGIALLKLARPADAVASIERAAAIAPSPAVHSNLIFTLNFDPAVGAHAQQRERKRFDALYAQPHAAAIRPHTMTRDPDRRLRVGYVSGHFRQHASTWAFGGAIVHHDARDHEVACYSDTVAADDVTERLRASAEIWRDTAQLSDQALAEIIRSDAVDVLVDTVGHMAGNRLLVFARKPAPVQVTAWGEPTGTGLATMDYLFADPILVPLHMRSSMAERVLDLPSFLGYWAPDPIPGPGVLPASERGHLTFGSFNRGAKIQAPVLVSWAAILRALPGARLVIKGLQERAGTDRRQRIEAIFVQEGVDPERVTLLGFRDRASHFADYQGIDLALDPFPHGGGMTTLDALWMGIPVITWPGETISSRLAAACLSALGLDDFIARDAQSYVALALAKAGDLAALASLRATLRDRMAASPLGDPLRYAQAVAAAYRSVWRRWCAG
jgi:predicted O-linked N-acetylglucosamine transferase (SPINDLY family)